MTDWNPQQYERFKSERAQPFHDLRALVDPRPSMRVVDLGCGTGELTRLLHESLGAAETVGVDNSPAMMEKAAAFAGGGLRFEQASIEGFVERVPDPGSRVPQDLPGTRHPAPGTQRYDLVFSNAALHWVEDHPALFARLAKMLNPGGQLAIQMPANHDHISQRVAAELAPEFDIPPRRPPMLAPEEYAALLHSLGFARQHVRLQVYGHVLDSARGVVEWVKGSTLTEYQRRLGDRYPEFLEAYAERLLPLLGDAKPFFFPFKRIHIWGAR
jgi:trans-aconitate 2-methyltransferase